MALPNRKQIATMAHAASPSPDAVASAPAAHRAAPKFTALQQLRGMNAFFILLWHAISMLGATAAFGGTFFGDPIGVDTFFVVAGFMMFYSSRNDFAQPGATTSYYARRIARIVPLYWIVTAVAVVAHRSMGHPVPLDPAHLLTSLFFIPVGYSAATDELVTQYKPGWFLDYLMFFDVIFGIFLFLPRRRGVIAIVATLLGCVMLGALFSFDNPVLAAWTRPVALKFAAGLGLGCLYLYRDKLGLVLKSRTPLLWFFLLFMLAFTLNAFDATSDGEGMLGWRLLNGLVAVSLVAVAVFITEPKVNGRAARLAHALGDASYSIYLSHPLFLLVLRRIWSMAHVDRVMPLWLYVVLCVPLCLAGGVLVYRVLEAPMSAWLTARWGRQRGSSLPRDAKLASG